MPLDEQSAAMIPEDIRSDPALQSFNDVGAIAKSYLETKRMVGDSIRYPDAKATPEDSKKWWGETSAKLAEKGFIERAPETADKYEWKFEGQMPEALANDKILAKYAPIAHELGLSNRQANALVERFGKDILPDLMPKAEFADAQELGKKTFGAKWTETQDSYKKAMVAIQSKYPGLSEIIKDGVPMTADGKFVNIFDHPAMISFVTDLVNVKQDFGGNVGGILPGESLDSITTEIADLRANKELPREEVGRRLEALYKKKSLLLNGGR